jgi:hypothetical protein
MLIQIERSGQYSQNLHGRAALSTGQRPSLGQAVIGGVKNLLTRRPVLAVFQANLRCNSDCGYCNLPLNEGRYEMTRDEIRKVFRGLYLDGLRLVFVQGGEPLLRRDLPHILEDLVQIGFRATVITNGTRAAEGIGAIPGANGPIDKTGPGEVTVRIGSTVPTRWTVPTRPISRNGWSVPSGQTVPATGGTSRIR